MWYEKKNILITDDHQAYLMRMSILLKKMGFNVVPTSDGVELIKSVQTDIPDLILLDINMSGLDGIKILKVLKEDRKTSGIPVVMISADSSDATWLKCINLGCDDYLIKPVSIERIHEVMQRCIYASMEYTRKNMRVLFPAKVSVTHRDESQWLRSETLSEMGIYVLKDDPLPVNSVVEVTIPLARDKAISLKGLVIYRTSKGDTAKEPAGMAIEFKEHDIDKLLVISYYVRGLLTIPALGDGSAYIAS